MKLMLDINITSPGTRINYDDRIFLVGSCFTEHIGGRLAEAKFPILQNPNGILFDPMSVAESMVSYVQNKQYTTADLCYMNELHQSWKHHSHFSGIDAEAVVQLINASQQAAHEYLKTATWAIITLGSSFSYRLVENGMPVANCHRAPGQWFYKHMMTIDETVAALDNAMHQLFHFNNNIKLLFTISPVRHIRDGVVENNRSKARLIEAVHHLVNKFDRLYYFPAYELVIDVLRDYRFYDIDLVHPNYPATEFVFEKFTEYFIDESVHPAMEEIKKIGTAFRHKPFQPNTEAHQRFLQSSLTKTKQLQKAFPQLDFSRELAYFGAGGG
jgi:hypothetical protein